MSANEEGKGGEGGGGGVAVGEVSQSGVAAGDVAVAPEIKINF